MDEKMIRFLKSIGIENISSFDMSFDLVKYDLFNPKQLNMVIRKETPWDYSLLRQFIDHLSNISYQYKLSFCYSNFPQVEEVKSMFYDWYQELYRVPSNVEINVKDKKLIFILNSLEDCEKYKSIIKDYQDFLNFIGYDFSLESKEDIKEEKQYTEKEIKKIIVVKGRIVNIVVA